MTFEKLPFRLKCVLRHGVNIASGMIILSALGPVLKLTGAVVIPWLICAFSLYYISSKYRVWERQRNRELVTSLIARAKFRKEYSERTCK